MTWRIIEGDCVTVMAGMAEASVDAVVTDPPYNLNFMGRAWDKNLNHGPWAVEALRVLKPGGHLLAFGGTRTYHRLTCALEDAGFEIRDCLVYMYGTGFPKSLNLDRLKNSPFCQCQEGDSQDGDSQLRGMRCAVPDVPEDAAASEESTLLPPMQRPSPRPRTSTARKQRPSGLDGSQLGLLSAEDERREQPSVEGRRDLQASEGELSGSALRESTGMGLADGSQGRLHHGASPGDGRVDGSAAESDGGREPHRSRPVEQRKDEPGAVADEPRSQDGGVWPLCPRCGKPRIPSGLGTALKPAHEPIVLARKPLVGSVAQNVLAHGTGALNIDGTRIGTGKDVPFGKASGVCASDGWGMQEVGDETDGRNPNVGRWPANVILDEDAAALLDEQSGERRAGGHIASMPIRTTEAATVTFAAGAGAELVPGVNTYSDTGGASRFFYVPKADSEERNRGLLGRSTHPTVKPVELMQWLCRLVTPPKGTILDPFTGSGSTGIAALREGFGFIGIEREPEYVQIARDRIIGDGPLFNVAAEVTA